MASCFVVVVVVVVEISPKLFPLHFNFFKCLVQMWVKLRPPENSLQIRLFPV